MRFLLRLWKPLCAVCALLALVSSSACVSPQEDTSTDPILQAPQTTTTQEETEPEPPSRIYHASPSTKNSGILIDEEHARAMERFSMSESAIAAYAQRMNQMAEKIPEAKVYCMLVPTAVEFYSPEEYHTGSRSQKKAIALAYSTMNGNVTTVDAYDRLYRRSEEYLYFRTDHHWTARGAYYAYTAFCKKTGVTPRALDTYQTGRLDGFVGTMYHYTQSALLKEHPDDLEYFMPATQAQAQYFTTPDMTDPHDMQVINTNVYGSSMYLAFIQGDNPLTRITTQNPNGKKIIVIKESYGNALVPFLVDDYAEVYVVDPRNITGMDLPAFVRQHGIQEILAVNYTFITGNTKFLNAFDKMLGI